MSDIRYNSWLHRSGTGGVYQDSSGRVGIGTSAIGALLAVPAQASGDSGVPRIAIESKVDANDFTISQYEDGTGTYTLLGQNVKLSSGGNDTVLDSSHKTASIMMDGRGNGALMFNTGGANETEERMRIDSSGHVGITSVSPVATRFSGTVSGLINLAGTKPCVYISETDNKDSSGTNRALYMGLSGGTAYAGSNAPFSFATGDTTTTERVRIRTDGRVSIASSVAVAGVCTAAAFVPSAGQLSNRNLVINGAMQVAQRGDTTGVQDGYGGCDRFKFIGNTAARATLKQGGSGVSPTSQGFSYCQHVDCTTADASLAAGDYHYLGYTFEGQDLQQLKKGTANAESITLSFWVSSPKTGTHILQLYDNDNNRHINKSYTVSSADTWEYKTLTFAGDTTGALGNDVNYSLRIYWWLLAGSNFTSGSLATSWASFTAANAAVGQVNVLDSTSNDFKLTGVQLEIGEYATPFEHRSYTDELARSQRYYWGFHAVGTTIGFCNAMARTSDMFMSVVRHPVRMRTSPSLVTSTVAGNHEAVWLNSGGDINASGITTPGGTYVRDYSYPIAGTLNSGSFGSNALFIQLNGAGTLAFNAEL